MSYGQFVAVNATAIDSTVARAIKAAPAAGLHYEIESISVANPTVSEDPMISIVDTDGAILDVFQLGDAGPQGGFHVFVPPLVVATAKGISGLASGSLGDTIVCVKGFVKREP